MTMREHYKSNMRDIFFNLFEVLNIGEETLGKGPYASMDEETAQDILIAFEKLCVNVIAPTFAASDREPLRLDEDGNVKLPPSIHEALAAYYNDGWDKLDLPESLGGFGSSPTMIWSAFELLVGANAAVAYYAFGTFIARIIDRLGTTSQRERYVKSMLDGHWGGAMVLTEPDAGSDVGAGTTRARHTEGGVWELEGTKRFITNGDYDYPDNVVSLVLARPEGAQAGTKGLSMFIVPKIWVHEDGSLGARNGVRVSRLEKKMGLKASSTCELTLGDRNIPCKGLLVGETHDGIRQMFMVIEHARMAVGVKSLSTLSTAYLNALAYTKDRVQGADLAQAANKNADRVEIIRHPDVRRMLMLLKCHAEGLRGLALYTAYIQEQIELLGGHQSPEAKALDRRNNMLLPLIKGYGSERVYELLGVALQCFGGSGYCTDYPMEQYIRDQKIDSLYEGTTHIQALDLFFRKIAKDGGATLRSLLEDIKTTTSALDPETFGKEKAALSRGIQDLEGIFLLLMKRVPESVYHVGLHGNRVLFALAELAIAWRLAVHATVAQSRLAIVPNRDHAFYTGKIASFRFFCEQQLPNLTLTRKVIERSDLSIMDLPDEAF